MMTYQEVENARLWDEYKEEQADWSEDMGGEFSAVFADEEEDEREGHESLRGSDMGVAVFCDGSCVA